MSTYHWDLFGTAGGDWGTNTSWTVDERNPTFPWSDPPTASDTVELTTAATPATISGTGTALDLQFDGQSPFTVSANLTVARQLTILQRVEFSGQVSAATVSQKMAVLVDGSLTATGNGILAQAGSFFVAPQGRVVTAEYAQNSTTPNRPDLGPFPTLQVSAGGALQTTGYSPIPGVPPTGLDLESSGNLDAGTINAGGQDVEIGFESFTASQPHTPTADLTVNAGGKAYAGTVLMSPGAASKPSTLTVDGAGSDFEVAAGQGQSFGPGTLYAGAEPGNALLPQGGTATINVTNGGKLGVGGDAWLGGDNRTNATAAVSGGGLFSVGGTLRVGAATGDAGLIQIQNGGTLHAAGPVAVGSAGQGTISVGDANSLLDATGASQFQVGANGGYGTVNVTAFSTASLGASALVGGAGARGFINASGAGATVLANTIAVGEAGQGSVTLDTGASLQVAGGGPNGLSVGLDGTGNGTLSVSGAGSRITSAAPITVGNLGNGNLYVENGALLQANGTGQPGPGSTLSVGTGANATGYLEVNGAGSTLAAASGFLAVGDLGTGAFKVLDGGTAQAFQLDVGVGAGATGNVAVDGAGSTLRLTGSLDVAGTPTAAGHASTVSATNGGRIQAGEGVIWPGSTIAVDGTGMIEFGSAGSAAVGAITVDAGSSLIGAGLLNGNVVDQGTLLASGGTLELAGSEQGSGQVAFQGPATLKLDQAQSLGSTIANFGAGDTIDLTNVTYAGSSDAFNGNTLSVTGGGTTANLHFAGAHEASDFALSPDAGSGTLVTLAPGVTGPTPNFSVLDTTTGAPSSDEGQAYTGPVNYLQWQYLWAGQDSVNVNAAVPSVFLRGGPGSDALAASAGSNVLDGNTGSNFLVGATGADGGTDTFFVDGRGSATTWSTAVNFHHGDAVTFWGFDGASSTYQWAANDGAAGYQGATIHAQTAGAGTATNASLTFAGVSLADAQSRFTVSTGSVGGEHYMYVAYTG